MIPDPIIVYPEDDGFEGFYFFSFLDMDMDDCFESDVFSEADFT